jgi:transcription initiation factor IIE alpha subunit
MSGFFDSQDFDFTCPNCKRHVKTPVSKVKRSDFKCPYCGGKFETSQFSRKIGEANREIERFKQQLGNIKIEIKL